MYRRNLSLTSTLGTMRGQRHGPVALPPGKSPGTHCTGGWLGLGAGLNGCGKFLAPIGVLTPIHPVRRKSLIPTKLTRPT
jgi:hypothetical protein